MINYLLFRIYDYFLKKDPSFAFHNTTNFMTLLLASLVIPIVLIYRLIMGSDFLAMPANRNIKYIIGIPLALILLFLCNRLVRNRLTSDKISALRNQYQEEKHPISIWFVFIIPVFNVFVVPIIYGLINGTLRFPIFET